MVASGLGLSVRSSRPRFEDRRHAHFQGYRTSLPPCGPVCCRDPVFFCYSSFSRSAQLRRVRTLPRRRHQRDRCSSHPLCRTPDLRNLSHRRGPDQKRGQTRAGELRSLSRSIGQTRRRSLDRSGQAGHGGALRSLPCASAAKPKGFPQVDADQHANGLPCQTCHQPHNPAIAAGGAK
jgi:hypothetical protein